MPLLAGCAARFECRAAYRHEGGDHEMLVGEVLTVEHFDAAPPVFQKGGCAVAVKKPPIRPAAEAAGSRPEGSISRDAPIYLAASISGVSRRSRVEAWMWAHCA